MMLLELLLMAAADNDANVFCKGPFFIVRGSEILRTSELGVNGLPQLSVSTFVCLVFVWY